ncbi:DoxX family protein [Paenibacillus hamazuiensis]|uniref:DoxX family protein n=1 Tax=Paenibacillus hamazuiensis TaxID=2936508 RepID=UPI00200C0ECB|nr:DoxX family protein [Paenibacillus hamazuiensis]
MKKILVGYWVFTGLLIVLMGMGTIPDIMYDPSAVELFKKLGYPDYLLPFLGYAKLLGIIAILIPGFPRIKEWVYAGFTFDLLGAMYSVIATGDIASSAFFIIGFALIAGSYIFHHKRLRAAAAGRRTGEATSANLQFQQ